MYAVCLHVLKLESPSLLTGITGYNCAAASDSNVKYLGRSGVATVSGLLVAFLDGQYNAAAYRAAEVTGTSSRGPGCRYYAESGEKWIAALQCASLRPTRVSSPVCWRLSGYDSANLHALHCQLLGLPSKPLSKRCAPPPRTSADVDRLKLALARAEGDIDVLLTCEWPAGLCDGLPDAAKPQGVPLEGAAMCTEVVLACRPRYHVATGMCCSLLLEIWHAALPASLPDPALALAGWPGIA